MLNKLQPGLVPARYEKPQTFSIKQVWHVETNLSAARNPSCFLSLFIQIETVGQYLDGCRKYGMEEKDLFVSVDLVEEQNRNMVCCNGATVCEAKRTQMHFCMYWA